MSRLAEIIRGDDQTVSVPVRTFFPTLIGATAHLFVIPDGAAPSDDVIDPSAVIHATIGPILTDVETLDFQLTSASGAASTKVNVATYAWYARVVEASGKVTTIRFDPRRVEVTAPGEDDC